MKNYVFIGAGPSSLWCVLELLDNGIKGNEITIIEKGKNPYDRLKTEVMNGFMGAGGFSDYKMIYSLTRGGELTKYTGVEKGQLLIDRIKKQIRRFHPKPEEISISGETIPTTLGNELLQNFDVILSNSEHIGTDYAIKIGKKIYNHLKRKKVKMYFEQEVINTDFNKRKITTIDDTIIDYDELIIGVGKSGMNYLSQLIKEYNLGTTSKEVQVGVRFESDHKYFNRVTKHFYDFKLHKKYGTVSARTFCVNNGLAFVAKEDSNGLFSYNGHAYREHEEKRDLTNFGIMLEMSVVKDPLIYTQEFVKYFNRGKKGCYYTPSNRKPTADAVKINAVEFNNYKKIFDVVFDFIDELDKVFKFGDDYVMYVPEIKYVTNSITLEKESMSIPGQPRVHIIGDSAGARGLFVSKAHGLHLADYFLK